MVFINWYSVSEDGKSNSAVLFFYGNPGWKNMYYVESYAARHAQPIGRAHPIPLSFRQRSSHMRSGLIRPPGASSLMLFGARSIGAAYHDIFETKLRICAWD